MCSLSTIGLGVNAKNTAAHRECGQQRSGKANVVDAIAEERQAANEVYLKKRNEKVAMILTQRDQLLQKLDEDSVFAKVVSLLYNESAKHASPNAGSGKRRKDRKRRASEAPSPPRHLPDSGSEVPATRKRRANSPSASYPNPASQGSSTETRKFRPWEETATSDSETSMAASSSSWQGEAAQVTADSTSREAVTSDETAGEGEHDENPPLYTWTQFIQLYTLYFHMLRQPVH